MAVSESIEELLHSGYRYALSLTHNKVCAEDILQDAWLSVLKANGPHTRPYLYSAIRSRFLNQNKREKLASVIPMDEMPELEEPFDDTDIQYSLDCPILEKALSELRDTEREALFLTAIEGYTANEIAIFTQQPRGTVLSHIHRAKQKIRRFFDANNAEAAP